jgi:hypothetical protein
MHSFYSNIPSMKPLLCFYVASPFSFLDFFISPLFHLIYVYLNNHLLLNFPFWLGVLHSKGSKIRGERSYVLFCFVISHVIFFFQAPRVSSTAPFRRFSADFAIPTAPQQVRPSISSAYGRLWMATYINIQE